MSIYQKIEAEFAATRGVSNTQLALIFSDKEAAKNQEEYHRRDPMYHFALDKAFVFRKQACFASIYGCLYEKEQLKEIVFDLKNPSRAYGNPKEDLAEDMLKQLYHTPWMKKNILNPTMKDAWNNNLRMKVDVNMSNEEVFMPLYIFRHIWECQAWDIYEKIREMGLFTKREAAWLSLCLTKTLQYRPGGHSAICSSVLNMYKYLHIMLGESPDFNLKRTPFFRGSPSINWVLGGGANRVYTKKIGEGFNQKTLADFEKIHENLQKLKKERKNA